MKKVLILIPSLRGGGAERVLVNLVNNIDKTKFQITLMTIFGGGVNEKYLSKNVNYKSVFPCYIRGFWRVINLFSAKKLHDIFIKEKYDIEIAYLEGIATKIISGGDTNTLRYAWLHCELTNHSDYFLEIYKNKHEFLEVYSKFDKVLCVSNEVLTSFKEYGIPIEKLGVIHNTLDTNNIIARSKEKLGFKLDKTAINFISIGRLAEQKGYRRLVRIFQRLDSQNVKVQLYILGEGPQRKILESMIKENHTQDVHLLGYQENPYNYLSKMDCFICSSYQEGFSTAASEALLLGVPVITTNCSGSEELCSHGTGLVTENDEEALYKTIFTYISNQDLREDLKNHAMQYTYRFSTDQTVGEFVDLLEND